MRISGGGDAKGAAFLSQKKERKAILPRWAWREGGMGWH